MLVHSAVAAVSDRRRRSEIDATILARFERLPGAIHKHFCRRVEPLTTALLIPQRHHRIDLGGAPGG